MNDRIKQVRQSVGLTQMQFAERLGLSRNFIAMVETGGRVPSDRTISDICIWVVLWAIPKMTLESSSF